MRSLAFETESSADMLLFDEPSASLNPTAEHGAQPCFFEMVIGGNKSLRASTELERQQDHDILHSPIWKSHSTCGLHFVSFCLSNTNAH
ncbi:hypothetical protein BDR04DRAFT_1091350 [Suillus decipiens]|nr:hypothetical protein BDR04DRAFT_1091350 [Suillus decipiens]